MPSREGKIVELAEALDSYIPEPERPLDRPFLMPVEDVFSITGRGTVATGRIEQGVVNTGDNVEIVGIQNETRTTVVTGVEMFRKILDEGQAGDNVGCLLRGVARDEVERGQVLCKPASITPHTKFKAQVYCLKKEEGGRHTPFFNGYRPQFYFRTTDVTGVANLPEGTEMVTARGQRRDDRGDDPADRHGRGAALRDPRGRPQLWARGWLRASSSRRRTAGRLHGGGQKDGARPQSCPDGNTLTQNKIRIRLKAYDHSAIETAAKEIVGRPCAPGASVSGPVPLPTEKNVYCVVRSPFKDKDSREHFEIRTHKRLIDILQPTPKTVDSLQRLDHLPAGVDIQIQSDVEALKSRPVAGFHARRPR